MWVLRPSWRSGTSKVIVSATGCRFEPFRKLSNYLNVYFHFFALVTRQSVALNTSLAAARPNSRHFGIFFTSDLNLH